MLAGYRAATVGVKDTVHRLAARGLSDGCGE